MKKELLWIPFMALLLGGCSTHQEISSNEVKEEKNYQLFPHKEGETEMDYFYNYCPTSFEEDGVRHIYYCANKEHGNVTDYVAYRRGVKDEKGKWVYGEIQYVLSPSEDTWDSRHVCDPSVIKGTFSYHEETYSYLMAYLGCVTSDNTKNEVGLAVAKAPEGPWVKIDANPICHYELNDNKGFQWGYGQPSLVSVDKKGDVLLFYTVGDGSSTYTRVERWDFTSLDTPKKVFENYKRVLTRGLKNLNGAQDYISNADFAYDPTSGRIYMIKDDHPTPDGASVSSGATIYYLEEDFTNPDFYPGYTLFNIVGDAWNEMDHIDVSISGFDLNHNTGFVTDPYGWTLSSKSIDCLYTAANNYPSFWGTLASYRIYQYTMDITE